MSPAPQPDDAAVSGAIARGAAFLRGEQLAGGGFLNQVWHRDDPVGPQANVFPAALLAHSLSFVPEAQDVRAGALAFLEEEKGPLGVWKHPSRGEYTHFFFPPDVDDTACAAAALRQAGRPAADAEAMLLANCDAKGLFYTWFTWRPRWAGLAHLRLVLPQLRHAHLLVPLFREPPCSIWNVDPVVNANALFCLGARPETAAIAPWLLSIVTAGAEGACDPWYPGAFAIRYFFSRALARWHPPAAAPMRAKLASAQPHTPLETAFHLCACRDWGMPADGGLIATLLAAQDAAGGWKPEPFYRGGDYWWGGAPLTTGFALEALARHRGALAGAGAIDHAGAAPAAERS
jgi:hypothetical protein